MNGSLDFGRNPSFKVKFLSRVLQEALLITGKREFSFFSLCINKLSINIMVLTFLFFENPEYLSWPGG
jgi:hypothetical protein